MHVYRMIERDFKIIEDYYANDDERKRNIEGEEGLSFTNIGVQVINALKKFNGFCPYCGREVEFMEYQENYTGKCPTAASFDHIYPGMTTYNNDAKLQVTCQQCNFAKSNATDLEFRCYLQSIKEFYDSKNKNIKKDDPSFSKKQELQALLELSRQMSFNHANGKTVKKLIDSMPTLKHSSVDYLISEIDSLDLDDSKKNPEEEKDLSKIDLAEQFGTLALDDSQKIPVQENKELPKVIKKKEQQFLELVRKIGYRDPTLVLLGFGTQLGKIQGGLRFHGIAIKNIK
ncbi:hypothetical protein BJ944DRAFT_100788 [Cunninghamella echinulata]|nr:hypothetical protein BJ944DRAFT_100788 [Cunninghamella echinulata]